VHALDLGAHLYAQLRVKIAERLVEQKHFRVTHDGTAHRDSLPLAAGQLFWPPAQEISDIEDFRRLLHPRANLGLRYSPQSQPERHVLEYRHMRIERVILEHHCNVAILGRHIIDDLAVDEDVAGSGLLEPGDHAQRGALSTTGRSHQDDEFIVGNGEADVAHRIDVVEALHNIAQRHVSHLSPNAA
jgi:hypothetical protein